MFLKCPEYVLFGAKLTYFGCKSAILANDQVVFCVQSLEKQLAGILRLAFDQCPTVEAMLRLLEVFEGISGRELVQVRCR